MANIAKSVVNLVTPYIDEQASGSLLGEWTISATLAPLHGPDFTYPYCERVISPDNNKIYKTFI